MSGTILISSTTIEDKMLKSCFQVIAAFFPAAKIQIADRDIQSEDSHKRDYPISSASEYLNETPAESTIRIEIGAHDAIVMIQIFNVITGQDYIRTQKAGLDAEFIDELALKKLPGKEPLLQILLKRSLCKALSDFTGITLPWGILTGIRPGKLMARMDDLHYSEPLKEKVLHDLYLVQHKKIALLEKIASNQKPFLSNMKERTDLAAVYLSIPFCPSRCFYCSFPSNSVRSNGNKSLVTEKLTRYLNALQLEIQLTGKMMVRAGLKANSIYIGGGTPTVLNTKQLESLLQTIWDELPIEEHAEFTVEAGRPDTIDNCKLITMKDHGVNRISINPQTMQDATLTRIGRRHTANAIEESFALARSISDWVINMDMILGLPGEGRLEANDSLEKVMALKPDNITVHSLALKRGSDAWESRYIHDQAEEWQSILENLAERLERSGYDPYYLYKQKNSVGNLENIGYALPGKVCRYNIAVIAERQNIIGLGAGSSSKILRSGGVHENIYHPIDITCYEQQLASVHHKISQAVSAFIGYK